MYQLCFRNFIIHLLPKMFSKTILSSTVYLFIQLETIVYILNNFSIYPEDYLTKLVKSLSRLAGGWQPAGNLSQDITAQLLHCIHRLGQRWWQDGRKRSLQRHKSQETSPQIDGIAGQFCEFLSVTSFGKLNKILILFWRHSHVQCSES